MNDDETNVGGWPNTKLRNYLNSTICSLIPEDLRKGIIDTKVVSGHGSTSGEENFISTDKIYLLSSGEILENATNEYDSAVGTNITRRLDHYNTLNNNVDIIKKYGNDGQYWWWLRSATKVNDTRFSFISGGDGTLVNQLASNSTLGVSPAFRLAD